MWQLVTVVSRMPKLSLAAFVLMLALLSGSLSYAGFLVVGTVSHYLGTGRVLAGLLLGMLFARVPWVREGRLTTLGILPRGARRPVVAGLLLLALATHFYRGNWMPVLFLAFAAAFLLGYPRLRKWLVGRALASLFGPAADASPRRSADSTVTDVEYRERKD